VALLDPYMWAPDYDIQSLANNLAGSKFLGDTPNDFDENGNPIIVSINGAVRNEYSYTHKNLALENQVVTDMVNAFGWSEMQK